MELIAHRGASAVAPESTRAAIIEAVKAKADMIELDVQMTKDNRLVIFHDDTLNRTTNGRGRLTNKYYRKLATLDSGSWFAKRFSGERILLTSQVFKHLPAGVRVNLELKRTSRGKLLITRLLRLVRRMHLTRRVIVSSFDQKLLRKLSHTPLSRALIARRRPKQSLRQAVQLGCKAWHPFDRIVTPKLIQEAHASGLQVRVWAVDNRSRARQLKRWGADGIFTNHPNRLRSAVL